MTEHTRVPAAICYVEIPAPDIEKAGSFYASVFGWQIKPSTLSDTPYWEFRTGDGQLTGGLVQERPAVTGGTVLYLKVESIDATLASIVASGGTVTMPKAEIGGGHGFSAFFEDPNGNRLGLYAVN
jgi:predicted enzyme related to lactoylglutathione lyase